MANPNQVSTLSNYDQFFLQIDGAVQSQQVKGSWKMDGKDVDIETIINGFCGQTLSPKKVVCMVDAVVPPTGMEFDAWTAALTGAVKKVKLQSAATGQSATGQAFVRSPELSFGVGESTAYKFELHCTPSTFS